MAVRLGNRNQAWQRWRHFDTCRAVAMQRIRNHHRQIQAAIRDMRERMAGIDSQGSQHRKNLVLKIGLHRDALDGVQLFVVQNVNMFRREQRQQFMSPEVARLLHKGKQFLAHIIELLLTRQSVRAERRHMGHRLVFQASQANHYELIKIRIKDREEFHSLQ